LFTTGAQAQRKHDGAGGALAACQPDVKKFCPDAKPGEGRIAACLKEHAAELSSDCKATLRAGKAARAASAASK
jgi:hypothetical protein